MIEKYRIAFKVPDTFWGKLTIPYFKIKYHRLVLSNIRHLHRIYRKKYKINAGIKWEKKMFNVYMPDLPNLQSYIGYGLIIRFETDMPHDQWEILYSGKINPA